MGNLVWVVLLCFVTCLLIVLHDSICSMFAFLLYCIVLVFALVVTLYSCLLFMVAVFGVFEWCCLLF